MVFAKFLLVHQYIGKPQFAITIIFTITNPAQ